MAAETLPAERALSYRSIDSIRWSSADEIESGLKTPLLRKKGKGRVFREGERHPSCPRYFAWGMTLSVTVGFLFLLLVIETRPILSYVPACHSEECSDAARLLRAILAPNPEALDLCDGLAAFARAEQDHDEVPEEVSAESTRIRDITEYEVYKSVRKSLHGEENSDTLESTLLQKVYGTCIDELRLHGKGIDPLLSLLRRVDETFPDRAGGDRAKGQLADLTVYLTKIGVSPFITFTTKINELNHESMELYIDKPLASTLMPSEGYENPSLVTGYRHLIGKAIRHFNIPFIEDKSGIDFDHTSLAAEVLGFEKQLTTLAESAHKSVLPVVLEMSDVDDLVPQLAISRQIEVLRSDMAQSQVFVVSPDYLDGLSSLLSKAEPVVIRAFVLWKVIETYHAHVEWKGSSPIAEFESLVKGHK